MQGAGSGQPPTFCVFDLPEENSVASATSSVAWGGKSDPLPRPRIASRALFRPSRLPAVQARAIVIDGQDVVERAPARHTPGLIPERSFDRAALRRRLSAVPFALDDFVSFVLLWGAVNAVYGQWLPVAIAAALGLGLVGSGQVEVGALRSAVARRVA